jgi:hypothetical protein
MAPYNDQGGFVLTFKDYSKETCTFQCEGVPLTAANFDAQRTLQDALVTAIEGISLGTHFKKVIKALVVRDSITLPASVEAQRETKWRVSYEDTTTHLMYSLDIPMADRTKLLTNSDEADFEEEDVAAFITAFEAYVKSPDNNSVTIRSITHTGRRA